MIMRNSVRSKEFNLIKYPDVQVIGGAVDKSNYNTIFLQLRGHLYADNDEGPEEFKLFFWGIKQSIRREIKDSILEERFISDFEISDTFKNKEKRYTYFILDFTFYPNDIYDPKSYVYTLDEVMKNIHRDNFISTPFRITKYKNHTKFEN